MSRPAIGRMPGPAQLDEESYIDFVEGMRTFNLSYVDAALRRAADEVLERLGESDQQFPIDRFVSALGATHIATVRSALMRSTQEMMWKGAVATCQTQAQILASELDAAEGGGPGSVRWTPDYSYPDYVEAVDIHLQPGSYHTDALAGYVYHVGTKVFFVGTNDNDEVHHRFVAEIPAIDHPVVDVLDIGCSIGQSATALKERYPKANVTGVDVAGPMVRYAHARAVRLGIDVNFVQQNAENIDASDESFDVVYSFIVFHELPLEATKNVISEVRRVLRPGGVFFVIDFPRLSRDSNPSIAHYTRDFDTVANGEMYASDFVYSDFDDQLVSAFSVVDLHYGSNLPLPVQIRMCRA